MFAFYLDGLVESDVNRVAITGLAMRNTAIRDPSPGAADSAFQFASWGSFQ